MTADNTRTVAVIGLGSMGLGVARSLLRAGMDVVGCDTNAERMEHLVAAGGRLAVFAAEAAENADAVVTVVVNAQQTEDVLFGDRGATSSMKSSGVVVSSATMAPKDACRIAAKVLNAGQEYLDAPISGGPVKAADGGLIVMASGSNEAFRRARPVLDGMAVTVYELGDKVGIGASFKIVNQLLAGVHIAAACEAILFAKRLNLDLGTIYKVITASAGNSWMFENRVPHILQGDYTPRSAVDIFTKDLGIVSEIGQLERFPMPLATMALQMFLMTSAGGMGQDDDASVARMIARATGLELPSVAEGLTKAKD
jgi:3-hydroxyisobutyrate dehydrogenase